MPPLPPAALDLGKNLSDQLDNARTTARDLVSHLKTLSSTETPGQTDRHNYSLTRRAQKHLDSCLRLWDISEDDFQSFFAYCLTGEIALYKLSLLASKVGWAEAQHLLLPSHLTRAASSRKGRPRVSNKWTQYEIDIALSNCPPQPPQLDDDQHQLEDDHHQVDDNYHQLDNDNHRLLDAMSDSPVSPKPTAAEEETENGRGLSSVQSAIDDSVFSYDQSLDSPPSALAHTPLPLDHTQSAVDHTSSGLYEIPSVLDDTPPVLDGATPASVSLQSLSGLGLGNVNTDPRIKRKREPAIPMDIYSERSWITGNTVTRLLQLVVAGRPTSIHAMDTSLTVRPRSPFLDRLSCPDLDIILVPLEHSKHWMLVSISRKANNIEMFDSLPKASHAEACRSLVGTFIQRLRQVLDGNVTSANVSDDSEHKWLSGGRDLNRIEAHCPPQNNGYDCGIAIIVAAIYVVIDRRLPKNTDYAL